METGTDLRVDADHGILTDMSRPLRIEYPGAWYHVINRALTGQEVFVADLELLRGRRNEPRKVAMYLIRELCDRSLNEIPEVFSLGRYASVGTACASLQRDMNSDPRLRNRIQEIREVCVERYLQKKDLTPFLEAFKQLRPRGVRGMPVPEQKRPDGARFLHVLAAFVVVIAGMHAASSILVPFLLSAFVAIIFAPLLFWLKQRRIPGPAAVAIVIIMVLGIGASVGVLVGASVKDFSAALPLYQTRLQDQVMAIVRFLDRMGIEVSNQVLIDYFNPAAVMRFVAGTLTKIGSVLTHAFFILLTVAFILLEVSSFTVKLRAILGGTNPSLANFDKVISEVKHYLALKTLISLATGIAIAIWLAALGVDYPLLWGLLAFVLNFVPNIGSIIAAIPAVLLALIQLGFGSALLAAIAFLVVNVVIGFIIEPRLMAYRMGLSALVVFLSLIFWGWVLGPIGMLLSVPLTMTVKIALQSNDTTLDTITIVWETTAARLESLKKACGTWILVSEKTRRMAGDGFEWRRIDRTAVKGRKKGEFVYELLGERGKFPRTFCGSAISAKERSMPTSAARSKRHLRGSRRRPESDRTAPRPWP